MLLLFMILHFLNFINFTEAQPLFGIRQVCECDQLEVRSSGEARDYVPSYLGNVDKRDL